MTDGITETEAKPRKPRSNREQSIEQHVCELSHMTTKWETAAEITLNIDPGSLK